MNETLALVLIGSAIISVLGWMVRALHENTARARLQRCQVSLSEPQTHPDVAEG
jgi:hypothetical protein